jgi:hypothetical protein
MRQRGIPREAVEHVLDNPHTQRPAPHREGARPTVIYIGDFQGRNLKVYVRRNTNPMIVTTVVWQGD